jgi:PAS domain S-box-containing protein
METKTSAPKKSAPQHLLDRNVFRYGLALGSVALAVGVGLLAQHCGIGHQFAMLLFAIAVAGWNGGLGPAVVAAVFSSLAYDYFFTPPTYQLGWTKYDLIDLALYISFAFLITWFREVRWRTEGKLRASEQKYRELIDASPDAIFVWDKDGNCVLSNASAAKLRGCAENELTGLLIADTYLVYERDRIRERFDTGKSEGVVRFERQFLRQDNQVVPVEVSLSTAGEGNYQAVVRDITDRKRAERELRKQAELLSLAHDAIIVRDPENRITFWNPGAEETYGWTAAEAFGKVTHELLQTRFPEPLDQINTMLLRTGRWEGELIHTKPDGTQVVVASRWSLRRGEHGTPAAILEINRDITDRKRAERKLRKQADLLSLAHDAIIVRDPENRITLWNPGAEETYGWTAAEAFGKVTHELLQTRFPVSRAAVDVALQEQREWEGELTHITRAGKAIIVASRQSMRRDEQGLPAAILEINRDITDRKRAEDEIRNLNEELEQRVIERTGELQSVNKELEAFAYSVSHDLRAPVRHIAGFSELLQKHAEAVLDQTSRHHINMILDSANRMGTLMDDLLAFSRIGRTETQNTTVDLSQIVKGVIREFAPDIQEREVVWRIGDLPKCYGDPAMLRLAFTNLVSNALKFTQTRDQAEIEIGSLNHKPDEMVIFVKDNGVGFDMRYKDKLFGVFQRLHPQEAFDGTGIGLATVQRIVHRHGGKVWPESSVGNGATFYVALPKPRKLDA